MAEGIKASGSNKGSGQNRATSSAGTLTVEPQTRSGDAEEVCLDDSLLPDIPNDVTLDVISAKLPWGDILSLSRVSPCWGKAISDRLLYNSRVRTGSVETLAVVAHKPPQEEVTKLSLYSMREDSWYELPSIPGLPSGIPSLCHCASLDARVYIFGGSRQGLDGFSRKVYVLDVAGDRKWKQCASMLDSRANEVILQPRIQSGVIDGKIFVFGAGFKHGLTSESEVYDPKVDAWSRVKPMMFLRLGHQVTTVGKEFIVHGGLVYEDNAHAPKRVEAYCPAKEEWRLLEPLEGNVWEVFLVAEGKIYLITELGVYVYDLDQHSRRLLQPCLFPEFGPTGSFRFQLLAAVHMNGEILLLVDLLRGGRERSTHRRILRSSGFGQENKVITWKRIKCPCGLEMCLGCDTNFLMGSIQL